MKVGLSSLFIIREPFETLLSTMPKYDVKYWEIFDDGLHALNKKRSKILSELKSSYDTEYTVHAPVTDTNIASMDPMIRRAVLKRLENSLIYSGMLESRVWVFHPGWHTGLSFAYPGKDWQINLESTRKLAKVARDIRVEIAIENFFEPFLLKDADDLELFFSEVEGVYLTLDTGHANMMGQLNELLERFANIIKNIHAHDNDGSSDDHLAIGDGNINWDRFFGLLAKIRYDGHFSIEAASSRSVDKTLEILPKFYSKYGISSSIRSSAT